MGRALWGQTGVDGQGMDPQAPEVAECGVDQPVTGEGWEPHEGRRNDTNPVVSAFLRADVPRVQRTVILNL